MIARTFASVFPRQSPSWLILASMNAEPDSSGALFFMAGFFMAAPFAGVTLDALRVMCNWAQGKGLFWRGGPLKPGFGLSGGSSSQFVHTVSVRSHCH